MKKPAQGTYFPVIKINPKGKYPASTISNIKSSNFRLSQTDRWSYYKYKSFYF